MNKQEIIGIMSKLQDIHDNAFILGYQLQAKDSLLQLIEILNNKVESQPEPKKSAEEIEKECKDLKELVLKEYEKGNIVISDFEGFKSAKLDDIITQPVDGLLYDLNRNEAVILTFINDPKWVNDYALTKVVRKLYEKLQEYAQQFELPNDEEIEKAANEYEFKASCGHPIADYINEDFIAGVNWLKEQIK